MSHHPADQQPAASTLPVAPGSARRHDAVRVLLFSLVVALAFQGSRHLYDPDEGRYTNVALQMIESGDWLVPRLDPERPHFTKPPLTYWAVAASFSVLGQGEWAARLPNALAFCATALLVLGIARRLRLPAPAFAACAWAVSLGPVLGMNVVTTDTLLALFETLAVLGFLSSGLLEGPGVARRGGLRLMWLGFGLAFLTKGPPGLLPLLAIVAFVTWRRRTALAALFDPAGLALFALVGLGWFVALVWHSPGLLDYFLRHETIGRVASGEHHRNAGWFGWLAVYPPTLLVGSLPWLAVLAVLRWRAVGTPQAGVVSDDDARRFLVLWIAVPLTVFVLAQSRLPLYVLPLFVPVVLLAVAMMGEWPAQPRRAGIALAVAACVAVGIKGAGALLHADGDAYQLSAEVRRAVDLSTVDEIVFVDTPVRYGLKHYLRMDIEQAESRPGTIGPAGYAAPEDLCHELTMPDRLLLFTPTRQLDELQAVFDACGQPVERLGELRKWTLLRSVHPGARAGQEAD